ncbi:type I 3-dehydroquinate dehydratase [Enteractinococcus helveticum]|uniref:type I 3-dehydroquinate dehydratase n=1 Tax=Enteractinococcus helveticum TaxID=1837282 RepID=UPI003898F3F5
MSAHLEAMIHSGTNIAKVADMHNSPEDVLTSISTSRALARKQSRPSMAMVNCTMASRRPGEIFASPASFATIGRVFAPGQRPIEPIAQAHAWMS